MPPLPRQCVRAREHALTHRDAAAAASAEDDAEHHIGAGRGAVGGLREREAVGVVGQSHRPRERDLEVFGERFAVQPRRVGVFHAPGCRRHRAWNADANRGPGRGAGFEVRHHRGNGVERLAVVVSRCRDPNAPHLPPGRVERDALDLRAADVDTNPKHGFHGYTDHGYADCTDVTDYFSGMSVTMVWRSMGKYFTKASLRLATVTAAMRCSRPRTCATGSCPSIVAAWRRLIQ